MALLNFSTAPYGGEVQLLPQSRTQSRIRPTQLIFHSIVGSAFGAVNYFRGGVGVESTFVVAKSGRIWQLMDTERRADANYRANVRAGSVETEDNGDPDSDPWTAQQLAALQWLAVQYHRVHRVPLRQCPAWDAPGIGYHRLFLAQWSTVPGKTCPGDVRVRQFHRVLLPSIVAGEELDVPYGHWPADHRQALVRDVAAQVKWDVLGLQRLMLQFLAAGQFNSVFPGEPRPAWSRAAVSTSELAEQLRQLTEALAADGLPVTTPAPPDIRPDQDSDQDLDQGPDQGPGQGPGRGPDLDVDGGPVDGGPGGRPRDDVPPSTAEPPTTPEMPEPPDASESDPWSIADALQARLEDPNATEADTRAVNVALLARAVVLLRGQAAAR